MRKLLLSLFLVVLMVGSAWAANVLNPTVPKTSDPCLDITFDGSTALDIGFPRAVVYAEYVPKVAGNSITIRNGSATAPRLAVARNASNTDPQMIYLVGVTHLYVVGNEVSVDDVLILRFK